MWTFSTRVKKGEKVEFGCDDGEAGGWVGGEGT